MELSDIPLIPESAAHKHTRIITSIGAGLYLIYGLLIILGISLGAFFGPSLDVVDSVTFLVIGGVILLIDILLPLRGLQKIYKYNFTSYKTLFYFIAPTLTGLREPLFVPIALFNIGLVIYFYYRIHF